MEIETSVIDQEICSRQTQPLDWKKNVPKKYVFSTQWVVDVLKFRLVTRIDNTTKNQIIRDSSCTDHKGHREWRSDFLDIPDMMSSRLTKSAIASNNYISCHHSISFSFHTHTLLMLLYTKPKLPWHHHFRPKKQNKRHPKHTAPLKKKWNQLNKTETKIQSRNIISFVFGYGTVDTDEA